MVRSRHKGRLIKAVRILSTGHWSWTRHFVNLWISLNLSASLDWESSQTWTLNENTSLLHSSMTQHYWLHCTLKVKQRSVSPPANFSHLTYDISHLTPYEYLPTLGVWKVKACFFFSHKRTCCFHNCFDSNVKYLNFWNI